VKPKEKLPARRKPLVIATVHNAAGLRQARRLRPHEVDYVELRLDRLAGVPRLLEAAQTAWHVPLLVTARHPAEGGGGGLSAPRRRALLRAFLPQAAAVDVEWRSVRGMQPLLLEAKERGLLRIISFHDFRGTPSAARLRRLIRDVRRSGADLVKIATRLRSPRDLAVLLELQAAAPAGSLATMGMGELGRVSRLVLAAAGSRLSYGYLDRAQVPGQWPAKELRLRLREVLP
jgi:3-dehydroquinate dehydratase-1